MAVKLARPVSPRTSWVTWVAPAFAAVLSAITLATSLLVRPHSYEPGFPAFFCFLPMAFYFAAAAQVETQKQVRELQRRVEQIEAQAAPPLA